MITRIIDGVRYEFPDGTPDAVIARFEASKRPSAPAAASTSPSTRDQAMLPNFLGSALQGLSMGFSDEAIAAMRAGLDPRQTKGLSQLITGEPSPGSYQSYLKAERQGLKDYGEQNPIKSTVAELGGGLAPALISGGFSAGPTAARMFGPRVGAFFAGQTPSIARMAGVGAGQGAVSAVGTSEKPISDTPGEAVLGGIAGGATAGTLGVVGRYAVMPGYNALKRALGFGDANRQADIVIARALQKDGLTPDQALQRVQGAVRGEMALADVGENTAALLKRASQAPGAARDTTRAALVQREQGRVPRVQDDLRQLMSGSQDFFTDVQDLIRNRAATAGPIYDAAYAKPVNWTPALIPEIEKLRNRPSFHAAMLRGVKRMEDQGRFANDPSEILRGFHETKLALDDMIAEAVRTGETNQAGTLRNMKRTMLDELERVVPEYGMARRLYAGDSEMMDAMNEGRNIYTLPEPEVRQLQQRFAGNPSEYDAFRAGISQAMLERLRNARPGTDPLSNVFPRDSENRIRRTFADDGAFNEFLRRLQEERTMLGTERAGFRRTPVDTDLAAQNSNVGAAQALITGNPMGAGIEMLRNALPSMGGLPPQQASRTAGALLTPAPQLDPVVQSIMESLQREEQVLANKAFGAQTAAAGTGAIAASRAPSEQYPQDE
jgi:hypothetical protein